MILIADSGGSKIDWRLLTFDGTIVQANTPGFNPYYQPIEDLTKNFKEVIVPRVTEGIQKIFFYGAGVSSEKNQMTIKNAFLEFFPKAQIEIGWDLLAAARHFVAVIQASHASWALAQIPVCMMANK